MIDYHQKLARVLDRMGGVYLVPDILERIHDGRMQSFAENNTWTVTQVVAFPRARQLQVVALVGDLTDIDAVQAALMRYCDHNDIGLISAYGRRGWMAHAAERGWTLKARNYLYQRSM